MNPFTLPVPVQISLPHGVNVSVATLHYRKAIDDPALQRVSVYFSEAPFPAIIWDGASYLAAGDWTQDQLTAAISSALATNAQSFIESLFAPHQDTPQTVGGRMQSFYPNGIPRPLASPLDVFGTRPFVQAAAPVAGAQPPVSHL